MSPIFVRPVREQLEHDRLVRYLHSKYKRKFEVVANMGDEQLAPVKVGSVTLFPDLVLTSGKKLAGIVEVESGESVNNLEAMAQWVHFAHARVPFHLYVPVPMYDTTRRLCEAHHARVSEIWTYRPAADGFDLVRMFSDAAARNARAAKAANSAAQKAQKAAPKPASGAAKPAISKPAKSAAKPAKSAGARKPVKPAASSKVVARAKSPVRPKKAAPKGAAARRK